MATTSVNTSTAFETFGTTSPVTGADPTLATDGQALADLQAITVEVASANGTTLSGAGTLQGWVYDSAVGVWARAPYLDLTVTATKQAQSFNPFLISTPRNARVKWVPSGVTFSAGSAGVTVWQLGQTSRTGWYP